MQMSMIAYSTLDIFDEKQKLSLKPQIQPETFKSFLGLLQETFVSHFQLDVYGYIACTNYKIIIMKNETKTNKNGGKPLESKLKELFEATKRIHTKMILNPFFTNNTSKANGRGDYLNSLEEDLSSESSNSDASSSGSVGSRESFEKKDRPPVRYWSTKAVNR